MRNMLLFVLEDKSEMSTITKYHSGIVLSRYTKEMLIPVGKDEVKTTAPGDVVGLPCVCILSWLIVSSHSTSPGWRLTRPATSQGFPPVHPILPAALPQYNLVIIVVVVNGAYMRYFQWRVREPCPNPGPY